MASIFGQRHKIQELQAENRRLHKTQELLVDNILTVQEKDVTYTGNRYKNYSDAVTEVTNKYQGITDWGGLQVGNIVDIRAAYIIGQGIEVKKVKQNPEPQKPSATGGLNKTQPPKIVKVDTTGDAEMEFAERFLEVNELDHELPQDLAREAELEGKILIKLFSVLNADDGETDILIRWVSWTTNKYTVNTKADDYSVVESVTWQPSAGTPVVLTPDMCVYKRFAGRLDNPNETMPRVAKCLTQIENLDIALRDWRQINKLYAAPTPHIQCENTQQARDINEQIENVNWKIGKFLAHTGVFGYAQPSSEGQKAIESEIITLLKLISGATGVPIHFLGAPELTTKYGAANEGLLELIAMSTSKEREIWRAAYKELLGKAMRMWNVTTGKTPLDPDLIDVELPQITKEQWDRITAVWLPLRTAGEISTQTLLGQVPGLDVQAELDMKAEAEASMLEKLQAENESLKIENQATNTGGNNAENFGGKNDRTNRAEKV